jgi:anthranilate 1,2-dioxygenase (deaminating, decarboxylating) large subunit
LNIARDGAELDKLEVFASATRFLYISPLKILGGSLGAQMIVPWVRASMKLDALTPGGPSEMGERRNAVGDITFGPNLSWHSQNGLSHAAMGLDITAPTGPWNEKHLVNIGANVWSFSPVLAVTVFLPWHPNLSAGIKMDYGFSTRNDDFMISPSVAGKIGSMSFAGLKTHLSPGQEFHFDYSIEYALTQKGAAHQFRIGASGYFYQQTTNDKTGEGRVKHDLGRVFAIGPGVWWTYRKWVVEAHTAFETAVRNRPEGINTYLTIIYGF